MMRSETSHGHDSESWVWPDDLAGMYIETMKHSLCDSLHMDRVSLGRKPLVPRRSLSPTQLIARALIPLLRPYKIGLYHETVSSDPLAANNQAREEGTDWPEFAETMMGLKRMDNLKHCVIDTLQRSVPGDFIETGVWRGGGTIFMRAILKAHGVKDRKVWVADSFQGLPKPNSDLYQADANDSHHMQDRLRVSLEQVKKNFAKYGLLDDQVQFLKGWFKDTLHLAPIEKLAVLRLDGDMYESTMDGFKALYHKLSPGGYCIVDDYGAVKACKLATHDFRMQHGIDEPITQIDWTGVFWQKRR